MKNSSEGFQWRHGYIASIGLLWIVQTLARLYFFRTLAWQISASSMLLHLIFLVGLISCLLLILAGLPANRHRQATAWFAAAIVGCVHALITIFDLLQFVAFYFAGMPAPLSLLVNAPRLLLSLLDNVGISAGAAASVLLAVLAFHLLLYARSGQQLIELARRAAGVQLGRIRGRTVVTTLLLSVLVLKVLLPKEITKNEPFHRGSSQIWQMAPETLMTSNRQSRGLSARSLPPPPGSRPLVLIVVDALRRDRMGIYNRRLNNTPFLSSLAEQGRLQRFTGYSTCTFSFCGVMSILASQSWNSFDPSPRTVVDVLGNHGYQTHLILGGKHTNFGQMVDLYGQRITSVVDQPAGVQPDDRWVLDRLRTLPISDPNRSFLYLHLISTHGGAFLEPQFRTKKNDTGGLLGSLVSSGWKGGYRQVYDLRVAQTDDMLRRLFLILERKGLLKDALIIITSDHGERIGENGMLFHGGDPDAATITIPILVYDEQLAPYKFKGPASQIDVAPTLLQGIGLAAPTEWRGVPLQLPHPRSAVPIGTFETTGTVTRLGGEDFLYLCDRSQGRERVVPLSGQSSDQQLALGVFRQGHRVAAAPISDLPCLR